MRLTWEGDYLEYVDVGETSYSSLTDLVLARPDLAYQLLSPEEVPGLRYNSDGDEHIFVIVDIEFGTLEIGCAQGSLAIFNVNNPNKREYLQMLVDNLRSTYGHLPDPELVEMYVLFRELVKGYLDALG